MKKNRIFSFQTPSIFFTIGGSKNRVICPEVSQKKCLGAGLKIFSPKLESDDFLPPSKV